MSHFGCVLLKSSRMLWKNPEVPELEAQVTSAQVIDEMKEEVAKEEGRSNR